MDADSRELRNQDVVLPWEKRIGAAEAIEVPSAQNVSIVRGDGAIFQMDVLPQRFADTATQPDLPDSVFPATWPSSPGGGRLYLGYKKNYNRSYDNRFYLDCGRPPESPSHRLDRQRISRARHSYLAKDWHHQNSNAVLERRDQQRRQIALGHGSAKAQHLSNRHRKEAPDWHP